MAFHDPINSRLESSGYCGKYKQYSTCMDCSFCGQYSTCVEFSMCLECSTCIYCSTFVQYSTSVQLFKTNGCLYVCDFSSLAPLCTEVMHISYGGCGMLSV